MDCADYILTGGLVEAGRIAMGKVFATLLVGLMLTIGGGIVCAGPLEEGWAAYDRGDYATAMLLWRPLTEHGNANAQLNLGLVYEHGDGVSRDYKEAAKWYRLSAEQGEAAAQNQVGSMYAQGQRLNQDYKEAVKWYRLSAEQGYADGQSNLGIMYAEGRGVTQDYLRAHMWFNLAASKLTGAKGQRAIHSRDTVAKNLTVTQVIQAQEMARQCEARSFKKCD
jgi:TPR repeat protein